jgi:hypothetical protein
MFLFTRWNAAIVLRSAAVSSGLEAHPDSDTVVVAADVFFDAGLLLPAALNAATSESAATTARKPVSFQARDTPM